jgi:hypothetical protein
VTAVIRWEAPPVERVKPRRIAEWDGVASDLRARPGEWALIAVGVEHTNTAGQINAARIRCFAPAGAFEAQRQLVDGEIRVYARYVAEEASSAWVA